MLGVTLLFVGIVLINNGICGLLNVDKKTTAALNVIVGFLLTFINFVHIYNENYYAAAAGLLFAFTYLFIAANNIFNLSLKPFGVYCLFVAINTIPFAIIAGADDMRMAVIWIAWGVLWFTGFVEGTLGKSLGRFVPCLAIIEGIVTAWIPGFLLLTGKW